MKNKNKNTHPIEEIDSRLIANVIAYRHTSGSKKANQAKEPILPSGVRLQTVASLALPPIPDWLNEYPLVIGMFGIFYLRNTKQWVKETHREVKQRYQEAVSEDNETEANRLMKGLTFLNKYYNAMPYEPEKAKSKPLMWYVTRLAIWADITFLGGIKPYHAGAMLALAEKYGVDYYGNVYQSGW